MEPQPRLGLAALTQIAFQGVDLAPFRAELMAHCVNGTASAGTFMDLSFIEQLQGNLEIGLEWQSRAFETCRIFRTFRGRASRKTLLVFAAPIHMGGNTPIEFLLPGNEFDIITCYPSPGRNAGELPLPAHDVAFCAAPADAPGAEAFFEQVRRLHGESNGPVLNLPDTFVRLERDCLPTRFEDAEGLRFPRTLRLDRESLGAALKDGSPEVQAIGDYPYVIRPVGSHAGMGLQKINSKDEFQTYLSGRDEAQFFVSEFIDYASAHDGSFRKYRVVFVEGQAYPCHMAISDQWDVWYMNAEMEASAEKRTEEAAFMDQFAASFSKRHARALETLARGIGLDYFGIDCAEDWDGNLVVFEADNALIIHDMDSPETFPYKQAHMHRVFHAFKAMLERAIS
ncbi:MAG: hypothetical protein AAF871_10545 [Pseudomonadota bacterium]